MLTRASGQLSGLFLIIGPPESGKSTTLSAMCAKIERAGRETDQRFSSVMSVAPRNNSDTYAALIQGSNKAVLAIENLPKNTALLQEVPVLSTGQLVVATVQTSNIPMAIALLQAGERTSRLIAQTLCGILVQRLVRLLCTGCKVPRTGTTPLEDGRQITSDYQQGCGCLQCSYTGFVGRRLISQVMEVTEEIRTALASNALASSLYTLGLGASPAMENEGRDLVQRGLTSREELQRVLGQ
ncbi:MAG: hypothetical protein Q7U16_01475 [Agitococcus sp.]|nr:hypothetical protein [Agitococcus sp.]